MRWFEFTSLKKCEVKYCIGLRNLLNNEKYSVDVNRIRSVLFVKENTVSVGTERRARLILLT